MKQSVWSRYLATLPRNKLPRVQLVVPAGRGASNLGGRLLLESRMAASCLEVWGCRRDGNVVDVLEVVKPSDVAFDETNS